MGFSVKADCGSVAGEKRIYLDKYPEPDRIQRGLTKFIAFYGKKRQYCKIKNRCPRPEGATDTCGSQKNPEPGTLAIWQENFLNVKKRLIFSADKVKS
jgi:hypothetical protein